MLENFRNKIILVADTQGVLGVNVTRVDTNWRFQFFAKYDNRFLLDVIIAIIATFFAKVIITISRLSLSISLE